MLYRQTLDMKASYYITDKQTISPIQSVQQLFSENYLILVSIITRKVLGNEQSSDLNANQNHSVQTQTTEFANIRATIPCHHSRVVIGPYICGTESNILWVITECHWSLHPPIAHSMDGVRQTCVYDRLIGNRSPFAFVCRTSMFSCILRGQLIILPD